MNPLQRAGALLSRLTGSDESRDNYPYSFQDWIDSFSFNGTTYPVYPSTTISNREEMVAPGFEGLINYAYKSNGVVFASELARIMLFSQARFQWQQMRNGVPGKLFGTAGLEILEKPWSGGTTADLLAGMIQDADLAGNSFTALARTRKGLVRLRPDWITIVAGSKTDPEMTSWNPEAEVLGYLYHEGGRSQEDPIVYFPEQMCHFAPIPDPLSPWRGLSWLTPVLNEVKGDTAATRHKLSFFENGATVNLAIVTPAQDIDKFKQWVGAFKNQFEQNHRGAINAYKTLYLGAGADAKVVGANMQQMEFAETQSAGENRIAMPSGVPAIVAGVSKGLDAGTYSNFAQFRRTFGDRMHWHWGNACGSLERIIAVPPGARLWYDAEHIPFLREDSKDQAAVQLVQAQGIRFLTDAGFDPDAAVNAVSSGDMTVLVGKHSGLFSVQLQPPGSTTAPAASVSDAQPSIAPMNGNGAAPVQKSMESDALATALALVGLKTEGPAIMPSIDVHLPEMHTQVDVHVPESRVEVHPPEVTVTMPEQPAPVVNVHVPEQRAPDVHVDVAAQPVPEVVVNLPDNPVTVNVPEQAAPVVNVNVPEAPEQVAPEVHVDVHVPEPKAKRMKLTRDKSGRVTGSEEV